MRDLGKRWHSLLVNEKSGSRNNNRERLYDNQVLACALRAALNGTSGLFLLYHKAGSGHEEATWQSFPRPRCTLRLWQTNPEDIAFWAVRFILFKRVLWSWVRKKKAYSQGTLLRHPMGRSSLGGTFFLRLNQNTFTMFQQKGKNIKNWTSQSVLHVIYMHSKTKNTVQVWICRNNLPLSLYLKAQMNIL